MSQNLVDNEFYAFHPKGKSELDRGIHRKPDFFENFIFFTSSHENCIKGYGSKCKGDNVGMINVFCTKTNIKIYLDKDFVGEDAKFVDDCICKGSSNLEGYGIIYSDEADEYAFCNAQKALTFLGSSIWDNKKKDFFATDFLARSLSSLRKGKRLEARGYS